MSKEQPLAPHGNGRSAAFWMPLFLAWLLALLATAGALFLGEVLGMTPCVLCWYQRIAMFPLVLVLGAGLLASDARCVRYAMPLASAGWGLAAYHLLVFWGLVTEGLVPCAKGPSCADVDLQLAGSVPIPLLSLLAFSGVLVFLWLVNRRSEA